MKKTALLAGVAGLTLAALAAFASPRGDRDCFGPGSDAGFGFGPKAAAALGLTDAQKASMKELKETCSQKVSPLRSRLFNLRQEVNDLWAKPTPDGDAIRAKQKEMSKVRDELQEIMVQCRIKARATLTPEQQQKLAGMKDGKGRHGGGCGDCGGMGGKEGRGGHHEHDCEHGGR